MTTLTLRSTSNTGSGSQTAYISKFKSIISTCSDGTGTYIVTVTNYLLCTSTGTGTLTANISKLIFKTSTASGTGNYVVRVSNFLISNSLNGVGTQTANIGYLLSGSSLTFKQKYVIQNSTIVTSSSTDLSLDTPATVTFELTESQTVMGIYIANSSSSNSGSIYGFQNAIQIDGENHCIMSSSQVANSAANNNCCFYIGIIEAGTHTISGQFAANYVGTTVTVSNRSLAIYIFEGSNFIYNENLTPTSYSFGANQDTSTSAFVSVPSPCTAIAFYGVSCDHGVTNYEDGSFIDLAIVPNNGSWLSGQNTAYQSPYAANYAISLSTFEISANIGYAGQFFGLVGTYGSTITISRSVLGVLFLDPNYCYSDFVYNTNSYKPLSTNVVHDPNATISRTTSSPVTEVLALAIANQEYYDTTNAAGFGYGLIIDGNTIGVSRDSIPLSGTGAGSVFYTYGQTITNGAHIIYGGCCQNTGGSSVIDSRTLGAIWFISSTPLNSYVYGVAISTALDYILASIESTTMGSGDSSSICMFLDQFSSEVDGIGSQLADNVTFQNIDSTCSGSGNGDESIIWDLEFIFSGVNGFGISFSFLIELVTISVNYVGIGDTSAYLSMYLFIQGDCEDSNGSQIADLHFPGDNSSIVRGYGDYTVNVSLFEYISNSDSSFSDSSAYLSVPISIDSTFLDGIGTAVANYSCYVFISSSSSGVGSLLLSDISLFLNIICNTVGAGNCLVVISEIEYVSSTVLGSGYIDLAILKPKIDLVSSVSGIGGYITVLSNAGLLESTAAGVGYVPNAENTIIQFIESILNFGIGYIDLANMRSDPALFSSINGVGYYECYISDTLRVYSSCDDCIGSLDESFLYLGLPVDSLCQDGEGDYSDSNFYLGLQITDIESGNGDSTLTNVIILLDEVCEIHAAGYYECYISFNIAITSTCQDSIGSISNNIVYLSNELVSLCDDGAGISSPVFCILGLPITCIDLGYGDSGSTDYILLLPLICEIRAMGYYEAYISKTISIESDCEDGIGVVIVSLANIGLPIGSVSDTGIGIDSSDIYVFVWIDDTESGTGVSDPIDYILGLPIDSDIGGQGYWECYISSGTILESICDDGIGFADSEICNVSLWIDSECISDEGIAYFVELDLLISIDDVEPGDVGIDISDMSLNIAVTSISQDGVGGSEAIDWMVDEFWRILVFIASTCSDGVGTTTLDGFVEDPEICVSYGIGYSHAVVEVA